MAKKLSHKLLLVRYWHSQLSTSLGCDSRAGLVGTCLLFCMMVVYRRKILKHKWIALAVVLAAAVGLWAFNFATSGSLFNRIERMLTLEGKEDNDEAIAALHRTLAGLNDIAMDNEKVEIFTEKGTLCMTLKDDILEITDGSGKELPTELIDNVIDIADERFNNININIKPEEGTICFIIMNMSL